MKRLIILLIVLVCGLTSIAQKQPFEQYGYKVKIATLSKGKYIEHFDQDTIVQVGTVLMNRRNGKIVAFVKYDTTLGEYSLKPELISRWMSPDPLADEFYSESPYNFVHSNPIRYVDPDGRFPIETIWDVGNVLFDVGKALYKHAKGDHASAKAAWGDAAWDLAAAATPYVPAGVSKLRYADDVVDAAKGADNLKGSQKLLPEKAGPTAKVSPSEVVDKTPSQVEKRAKEIGLEPKGDPKSGKGAYADPQTGKRRIETHPNATDNKGNPDPHGHVYQQDGKTRVNQTGQSVENKKAPETHLRMKKDAN